MIARVLAVALNAYREAVRARTLHALLALALATCLYALLVAALSIHEEPRVVADIGAASISLYTDIVAIVLGSSTLHREIEHKTIVPMLTRALRRHEYLVGKYLGTLITLAVFIALQGAAVLGVLAAGSGAASAPGAAVASVAFVAFAALAVLASVAWRMPRQRTYLAVPWSCGCFVAMALLASNAAGEQRLVLASCALTFSEAAIVAGLASFFASFSSPALTAVFTLGVFVVGREAEALGNIPARPLGPIFGPLAHAAGKALAHVVPNLNLYVPPRALLLGEVAGTSVWSFVAAAAQNAVMYTLLLLTMGTLLFRRRDFS